MRTVYRYPTRTVVFALLIGAFIGFATGRATATPLDMTKPAYTERATLMVPEGDTLVGRPVSVPWLPNLTAVLCFGRVGTREAVCFYRDRRGVVAPVNIVLQEVTT